MGLFDSFKKREQSDDSPEESNLNPEENLDVEDANNEEEHVHEEEIIEQKVVEAPKKSSHQENDEKEEATFSDDDKEVFEEPTTASDNPEHEKNNQVKSAVDNRALESLTSSNGLGDQKILTVINQKGGVGKSTTAINLGAALADSNKRVLIVDLDPQGNTTSGFGIEKNGLKQCVYDVLLNDLPINEVMIKGAYKTVDVVPATINLAGAEVELVNEIARENRLKDAVDSVKDNYDYVFIDCPPSLGLLTVNALVAADKLLIPIQTEFYALEGVTKLLDSMKRVKMRLNKNLEIFGVLLTMYDGRTTLAKQVADEVQKFFKDLVFETMIPRTVKISEAPSFGQPITQYEPTSKGAIAYSKLAKEVINRG